MFITGDINHDNSNTLNCSSPYSKTDNMLSYYSKHLSSISLQLHVGLTEVK